MIYALHLLLRQCMTTSNILHGSYSLTVVIWFSPKRQNNIFNYYKHGSNKMKVYPVNSGYTFFKYLF